jgi:hypothetical protein
MAVSAAAYQVRREVAMMGEQLGYIAAGKIPFTEDRSPRRWRQSVSKPALTAGTIGSAHGAPRGRTKKTSGALVRSAVRVRHRCSGEPLGVSLFHLVMPGHLKAKRCFAETPARDANSPAKA